MGTERDRRGPSPCWHVHQRYEGLVGRRGSRGDWILQGAWIAQDQAQLWALGRLKQREGRQLSLFDTYWPRPLTVMSPWLVR